jgi:hypothetical protein
MTLSEHFSYAEFTRSDTALRLGLTNDLPCELLHNAKATAAMLERIREFLGCPMAITSGYRCLELNQAIKSKDTSDHVQALAADFVVPGREVFDVAQMLAPMVKKLFIGQLLYEFSWIHVGVPIPENPNNRILTVQPWGYSIGVTNVS